MKRSKFNLSHTQLHTGIMGQLIPVGLVEVLPGDTFQHAAQALIRAAPLATPPMHPVRIDLRHFFVPNRLVWDNWEDFITGGSDGMNASVFPTMVYNNTEVNNPLDALGIPPSTTIAFNALPMRALNLIYNEFYRDQDLQSERAISTADGLDAITSQAALQANWEKDYFTTCRPWEQKGPDVLLPLGTTATGTAVISTGNAISSGVNNPMTGLYASQENGNSADPRGQFTNTIYDGDPITLFGDVTVDLSTATAATVNDLRLALALQRYQEARARFGSRYTEYLRYLGVRSSDARLQRPEYLGGGRSALQFSEVMSNNVTVDSGVIENRPGIFGGHGIGANRTNRYRKFFEEHGFVISLLSVVPQTMYPNGLFRHWNRRTKEDFFQKELQHIGQQQVLNKEITSLHGTPDGVFGYQDRYDEYRRSESQVHGKFRPSQYLDDWHFARNIPDNAALNNDFIRASVSNEPFQVRFVGEEPAENLYIAVRHQLVARRLLAARGSSFTF